MYSVKRKTDIISIPIIDNLHVIINSMMKVGYQDPEGTKSKICNWLNRLLEYSTELLYHVEIDEYIIRQHFLILVRTAVVLLTQGSSVLDIKDVSVLIKVIADNYTEVLMLHNFPTGNYNVIGFDVNNITVLRITDDEIQST